MKKMSDKEYFGIDAVSNSSFRLMRESVLHYVNRKLFELESSSINLGSAVHKLVLEPDEFEDEYAVECFEGCELNKNSKAYKEAKAKWLEDVEGKTILSNDEFKKISTMARNVVAIAGGLLSDGVSEVAFLSKIDGVDVKCKVDYYRENLGLVFDLKTTKSIKDFEKSIVEYGYGTQSAFYLDVINSCGYEANRFIFIIVESVAPYNVYIREMIPEHINIGRDIYKGYLDKYNRYLELGEDDVVKDIGFPEWYLNMVA